MTAIEGMRECGLLTVEHEADLLRWHHRLLIEAKTARARAIALAGAREQLEHYERSLVRR